MIRRVVTATIMLSIVYLGFAYSQFEWLVVAFTALVAWLCTYEIMVMLRRKGLRVYRRVATIGVLMLMTEATISRLEYSIHIFGLAVCMAWVIRMRQRVEGAWGDVSATCFTMAYIGIPLAAITHIFLSSGEAQAWLILTMAIIWSTDSFALFLGKLCGRTRLWPKISPGKTWEGSIGGLMGAYLVALLARWAFPDYYRSAGDIEFVLYVTVFSCIGQLGDLAESLLKRDIGVKDSGSSLTGHGGFLDLMDAVLFSAIPLLIYLELFQSQVLAH